MNDGVDYINSNFHNKQFFDAGKGHTQGFTKTKYHKPRISSASYLNTEDSSKLPYMARFTSSLKNNLNSPATKKLVFSSPKTNKNVTDILKVGHLRQSFIKNLAEEHNKASAWDKLFIKSSNNTRASPIRIPRKSVVPRNLSNINEKLSYAAPSDNKTKNKEEYESIELSISKQSFKPKEKKTEAISKSIIQLGTCIDDNQLMLSHTESLVFSESVKVQDPKLKKTMAKTEFKLKQEGGKHNLQILNILEKIDHSGLSLDMMSNCKPQSVIHFSKSVDSERLSKICLSSNGQVNAINEPNENKEEKDFFSVGQTKNGKVVDFPHKQKKKSFFFCCY